jgi:hypothetical protein
MRNSARGYQEPTAIMAKWSYKAKLFGSDKWAPQSQQLVTPSIILCLPTETRGSSWFNL